MNIEEAKEYLKEMKDNCIKGMMKGAIYTDEKAEKKALAIETVLSELEKKDGIIDLMADCIAYGGSVHKGEPEKVKQYFGMKYEASKNI